MQKEKLSLNANNKFNLVNKHPPVVLNSWVVPLIQDHTADSKIPSLYQAEGGTARLYET